MKRHDDIKLTRVDNTGMWLLQLESFCNWRNCNTASSLAQQADPWFCCYGMPGAGKTVLRYLSKAYRSVIYEIANRDNSSTVIDDLISHVVTPSTGKIGIAYLYADYRDQKAQTQVPILGTLLQQFLSGISVLYIPQEVHDTLEKIKKDLRTPNKEELLALLQITFQHLDRAFICIDALDELEAKTRSQLLQEISNLVAQTAGNRLRVFLTGRKHIELEVQKLSKRSIEIVAHSNDIRLYLEREIADDEYGNPESMDEALQHEVVTSLVGRSQNMYVIT